MMRHVRRTLEKTPIEARQHNITVLKLTASDLNSSGYISLLIVQGRGPIAHPKENR